MPPGEETARETAARILVVDDDAACRHAMRVSLESAGYRVVEAADGEEAINFQRSVPADVLVTDILMPSKDGIEIIQQIVQEFPATRVIAYTAQRGPTRTFDYLTMARLVGASKLMSKPFEMSLLVSLVSQVLQEEA